MMVAMLGLDNISFPGLDLATDTLPVPVWAVGAAGLVMLLLLIMAVFRSKALVRILVGGAAVALALVFLQRLAERERAEERRALDHRLNELTARVIAPGSLLGCLEPGLGDAVEGTCEKMLFAGPESIGAATALVAARWSLLADGLEYARKDPGYETTLDGLRRTLDADRFGFLAQVLAVREGCSALKCDALTTLREPNRVRANLTERTFEGLVARNVAAWPARARTPVAAAPPNGTPGTGITFPSAASIPPVSIMNSEPVGSAPAAPSAAAASTPAPQAAPRRPAAAAAPRPRPAAAAPVQLAPPPAVNAGNPPRTP